VLSEICGFFARKLRRAALAAASLRYQLLWIVAGPTIELGAILDFFLI